MTNPIARVSGFNDTVGHVLAARDLSWVPFDVPPQGLFHVTVWLGRPLLGLTAAAILVLAGSTGLAVAGLVRLGQLSLPTMAPLGRVGAALFAAWFVIAESPVVLLLAVGIVGTDTSFAPVHLWASPTETLAVGLSLLMLPHLIRLLEVELHGDRRTFTVVGVLAVLATFAKPTFTLALVPAVPAYLLLTRASRPIVRQAVSWCVAPIVGSLVVQFVMITTLVQPEHQGGVIVAPFETVRVVGLGRGGPVFFLSVLIPLVAIAAARSSYFRTPVS